MKKKIVLTLIMLAFFVVNIFAQITYVSKQISLSRVSQKTGIATVVHRLNTVNYLIIGNGGVTIKMDSSLREFRFYFYGSLAKGSRTYIRPLRTQYGQKLTLWVGLAGPAYNTVQRMSLMVGEYIITFDDITQFLNNRL